MRGLWKAALLLAPALGSADWVNELGEQGETSSIMVSWRPGLPLDLHFMLILISTSDIISTVIDIHIPIPAASESPDVSTILVWASLPT
jgi:hypothetical protein